MILFELAVLLSMLDLYSWSVKLDVCFCSVGTVVNDTCTVQEVLPSTVDSVVTFVTAIDHLYIWLQWNNTLLIFPKYSWCAWFHLRSQSDDVVGPVVLCGAVDHWDTRSIEYLDWMLLSCLERGGKLSVRFNIGNLRV